MESTMFKNILIAILPLTVLCWGMPARGAGAEHSVNTCPVGLVSGLTVDKEFGPNSQANTRCLAKRNKVKIVIQINKFCSSSIPNPMCTQPYALGNITNLIKDYEITHGMVQGKDYEIVAVVHSGGGGIVLKNKGLDGNSAPVTGRNQFQGAVETLISQGVKFYFCQNTTRSMIRSNILPSTDESVGGATAELIDGVQYVTAGISAIGDFESKGYSYIQP